MVTSGQKSSTKVTWLTGDKELFVCRAAREKVKVHRVLAFVTPQPCCRVSRDCPLSAEFLRGQAADVPAHCVIATPARNMTNVEIISLPPLPCCVFASVWSVRPTSCPLISLSASILWPPSLPVLSYTPYTSFIHLLLSTSSSTSKVSLQHRARIFS